MTTPAEADFIARLDRDPLGANQIADRYAAFRSRDALLTAQHERLSAAAQHGVSGGELDALLDTLYDDFSGFLAGYRFAFVAAGGGLLAVLLLSLLWPRVWSKG